MLIYSSNQCFITKLYIEVTNSQAISIIHSNLLSNLIQYMDEPNTSDVLKKSFGILKLAAPIPRTLSNDEDEVIKVGTGV